MPSAKYVRELTHMMEDAGFRVLQVEKLKKHMRLTLERGGITRKAFAACTPSDHRTTKNWISQVRRDFREFIAGEKR